MYTYTVYNNLKNYFTNNYETELALLETALTQSIPRLKWIDYIDKNNGQYPYILIEETQDNFQPETVREDVKIYTFSLTCEYIGGEKVTILNTLNAYRDVFASLIEKDPTFGGLFEIVQTIQIQPAFVGQNVNALYAGAFGMTFEVRIYDRIA